MSYQQLHPGDRAICAPPSGAPEREPDDPHDPEEEERVMPALSHESSLRLEFVRQFWMVATVRDVLEIDCKNETFTVPSPAQISRCCVCKRARACACASCVRARARALHTYCREQVSLRVKLWYPDPEFLTDPKVTLQNGENGDPQTVPECEKGGFKTDGSLRVAPFPLSLTSIQS